MTPKDREILLANMKASGGGQVALAMEAYDVLIKILKAVERIATALEK